MNPQYLFMGTADTLLETFWFLADSNNKELYIGVVGNHGCTPLLNSQAAESQTQRNKTHLRLPTFETTFLS